MRDNYVQELSRLRASNDDKKVELSRLRMEVSEGPSVSNASSDQYVPDPHRFCTPIFHHYSYNKKCLCLSTLMLVISKM